MSVRIFADMAGMRLSRTVTNPSLIPSHWILTIFGQAVNPHIQIGDNRIELTGTIPAGAHATIDSRRRTITLTTSDGQTTNIFDQGVRDRGEGSGAYCFQPIPPGTHPITWPSSFDLDLQQTSFRSDPTWIN